MRCRELPCVFGCILTVCVSVSSSLSFCLSVFLSFCLCLCFCPCLLLSLLCVRMCSYLAARIPAVAVLANGGMISKKELLNCVRHDIPVIVIEGSGRLADQVRCPASMWCMASDVCVLLVCCVVGTCWCAVSLSFVPFWVHCCAVHWLCVDVCMYVCVCLSLSLSLSVSLCVSVCVSFAIAQASLLRFPMLLLSACIPCPRRVLPWPASLLLLLPLPVILSHQHVSPTLVPQVARAIHESTRPEDMVDPDLREIMQDGSLYVYSVSGSALGLQQLLLTIISEQRASRKAAGPKTTAKTVAM